MHFVSNSLSLGYGLWWFSVVCAAPIVAALSSHDTNSFNPGKRNATRSAATIYILHLRDFPHNFSHILNVRPSTSARVRVQRMKMKMKMEIEIKMNYGRMRLGFSVIHFAARGTSLRCLWNLLMFPALPASGLVCCTVHLANSDEKYTKLLVVDIKSECWLWKSFKLIN